MNIGFTKMHGLGNDFVVIDNMNGRISLSTEQIIALCDRHKGIGADGVILVEASDKADCFMNYYNSDGSPVEMCGNGIRCTAKFLKDNILKANTSFEIDTRSGIKYIEFRDNDGTFSVNMGKPSFSSKDLPQKSEVIDGVEFDFASMGNPHAVTFVKNLEKYDLSLIGPKIECNKSFPNKINAIFVEEKNSKEFMAKVWERGCGLTLACGTAACAAYAILRKDKGIQKDIAIELPGGKLFFSENEKGEIIMRGPAVSVYDGVVEI